jgi:hypothetical protein
MSDITRQTPRARPEADHDPRPVIWSDALWTHVAERRLEAEVLRRIQRHTEADMHDSETDRIVAALIRAEGEVWVDTMRAVQIVTAAIGRPAKPDTIRSWGRREGKRRPKVRASAAGGSWVFHRDDLLRTASEWRHQSERQRAEAEARAEAA